MITAINIVNFKVLQDTGWIPVPGNVVFIGQNNSGKTTALQALALWNYGLQKWIEKKKTSKAQIRTGAVINRKDLFAIPVTSSKYL
jgi:AAA15 family ATPase/GTPase